jgi:FlaG/FlaF family flagellin (archaellin)
LKVPDDGDLCEAKFDGKDYPVTGPAAGGKTTYSLKKLSPSSFEVTEKLNGKADYLDKYTVSGDGKTLTDEGTPFSKKEITKAIYDRQ